MVKMMGTVEGRGLLKSESTLVDCERGLLSRDQKKDKNDRKVSVLGNTAWNYSNLLPVLFCFNCDKMYIT